MVMPEPGRRAVRRALANLNTPIYVVNHLLQLHPLAAAETLGAFVMNTTWGLGGFLDAAASVGLRRREADFGQTLARAGVGAGPYIVVPVLGPSTLRDGFGWVVDRAFHPATYFLGIPIQILWRGGAGVAEREAVADAMELLEESSLDYYSVLRSAYMQARAREIKGEGSKDSETLVSSF
jgi:phospholipid-binding lipoprotein MlaA